MTTISYCVYRKEQVPNFLLKERNERKGSSYQLKTFCHCCNNGRKQSLFVVSHYWGKNRRQRQAGVFFFLHNLTLPIIGQWWIVEGEHSYKKTHSFTLLYQETRDIRVKILLGEYFKRKPFKPSSQFWLKCLQAG